MKKLISILAISVLVFTTTSIGVSAYQGDGICTNKDECPHENCSNYGQRLKGNNQKKGGRNTGQVKRDRIYQSTRMNCNR